MLKNSGYSSRPDPGKKSPNGMGGVRDSGNRRAPGGRGRSSRGSQGSQDGLERDQVGERLEPVTITPQELTNSSTKRKDRGSDSSGRLSEGSLRPLTKKPNIEGGSIINQQMDTDNVSNVSSVETLGTEYITQNVSDKDKIIDYSENETIFGDSLEENTGNLNSKQSSKIQQRTEQNMREVAQKMKQHLSENHNFDHLKTNRGNIIRIETVNKGLLNAHKCSRIMLINILGNHLDKKDILEVRINKENQWVTFNISSSPTVKTKMLLSNIKDESSLNLKTSQLEWSVTEVIQTSIGVIKGLPLDEDAEEILNWCKENQLKVISVLKIGKTVMSLKFLGPLPNYIELPFRSRPYIIETYNPGPKRCLKCYSLKHNTSACPENTVRCAKCGQMGHDAKNCSSTTDPFCNNCKGKHSPTDPNCPALKKHKETKHKIIKDAKDKQRLVNRNALESILNNWDVEFPPLSENKNNLTNTHETKQHSPQHTQQTSNNAYEKDNSDQIENSLLSKLTIIMDKKMQEFEHKIMNVMVDKVVDLFEKKMNSISIPNLSQTPLPQSPPQSLASPLNPPASFSDPHPPQLPGDQPAVLLERMMGTFFETLTARLTPYLQTPNKELGLKV